jgi:hypothetical protein
MMSQVIAFESKNLPAFLKGKAAAVNSDLTTGVGNGGYPILSIKGKIFTLVKGDTRTVLRKPDDPEEIAQAVEIVILKANPHLSKVYYAKGYDEDATGQKPDCASSNGIKPDTGVSTPQAKTCALCPHNAWNSGRGGKGKACQDSRRVAIAAAGQLNEPMLLRVPPATLKPLAEYANALAKRGAPYNAVITKIRFEAEEATPKLTFTPVGFLTEDQYADAEEVSNSDIVQQIIGSSDVPHAEDDTPALEAPAKPAKAAPAKKAAVSDDDLDAALGGAPVVEEAHAKPAKKPAAVIDTSDLGDDLDAVLASLDD